MKKHQSLAVFGVLTSALLIGCDGDLDLSNAPGNENPNSNAMNVRMPKSLQTADDTAEDTSSQSSDQSGADSGSISGSPAVTKEAVKGVETIVGGLDAATAGAPSQALYLGADLLSERVEFAQEALNEIDNVWDQITTYCSSVAAGAKCEIPAGTLTDDSNADDPDVADDLLATALTYQSNPDDIYQHSLLRKTDAEFSETEQLRWTADRSVIAMNFESSWQDEDGTGTQSSDLRYSANSEGDRISLRDEFSMGDSTFTDFQQLHQLNDGLNGVEIKTEFNWADAYSSGKWQSHAVANDEGGKHATTASFDDEDSIWHSRETFDGDGELVSSEYCEQTQGVDCSEPANWNSEEIDHDVDFVDVEFEGTDDALEEAYEVACAEMDIEPAQCGFSETDMVMLAGAVDIFDNTQDVTVYLCIETGEDELACRAQDADEADSVFDIVEAATEGEEFSFEENGESEEVDRSDEDGEAFELIEIGEGELTELDFIDSVESIRDGDYDCEINEDGDVACDFEGGEIEVVDADEITELLEDHDCFGDLDDSTEPSDDEVSVCLATLMSELEE